jgi:2-polyprenyl-3-methyl-5-hydroxy-6-metoxy-1,4-benzoquinol methylase
MAHGDRLGAGQIQIAMNVASVEQEVEDFYTELKFPGPYALEDFDYYNQGYTNNFLSMYDQAIQGSQNVLDVGCGSGFITNYLAYRHPNTKFHGIDFCGSVEYAQEFSQTHGFTNVTYQRDNFLYTTDHKKYDCIISNGVIHHMPLYSSAISKIKNMLTPNGTLVLGVYNKYGKLAKKFFNLSYRSELLRKDQEEAPFETSFSHSELINYFPDYNIVKVHPSLNNKLVDFKNLTNHHNGGLTIYWLKRTAT